MSAPKTLVGFFVACANESINSGTPEPDAPPGVACNRYSTPDESAPGGPGQEAEPEGLRPVCWLCRGDHTIVELVCDHGIKRRYSPRCTAACTRTSICPACGGTGRQA